MGFSAEQNIDINKLVEELLKTICFHHKAIYFDQ